MTLSSDQMAVLIDSDSVPHDPMGLDSWGLIRPTKLCGLDRPFAYEDVWWAWWDGLVEGVAVI